MNGIDRPRFLTEAEVFAIHADQIGKYGGSAGIRDVEAIRSASAQPEMTFGGAFLHGSVWEMAAAYLFHLAMDHPFVDGNKRVAVVSASVFLRLNGYRHAAPDDEAADFVVDVIVEKRSNSEIAAFLKSHSRTA